MAEKKKFSSEAYSSLTSGPDCLSCCHTALVPALATPHGCFNGVLVSPTRRAASCLRFSAYLASAHHLVSAGKAPPHRSFLLTQWLSLFSALHLWHWRKFSFVDLFPLYLSLLPHLNMFFCGIRDFALVAALPRGSHGWAVKWGLVHVPACRALSPALRTVRKRSWAAAVFIEVVNSWNWNFIITWSIEVLGITQDNAVPQKSRPMIETLTSVLLWSGFFFLPVFSSCGLDLQTSSTHFWLTFCLGPGQCFHLWQTWPLPISPECRPLWKEVLLPGP